MWPYGENWQWSVAEGSVSTAESWGVERQGLNMLLRRALSTLLPQLCFAHNGDKEEL